VWGRSVKMTSSRSSLTRYAWLAIGAALLTIAMKFGAYWLTGSISLLSDALESLINLAAAIMALSMLIIAARPPDESHVYGHGKAEYFSSTVESVLIFIAAGGILYAAVERLINPRPLEQIGLGLAVSLAAALVNLVVARILLAAGKKHRSITLEADAQHLMTDVWTSVGVVLGLGLVWLSGWEWLDSIVAIGVALNITRTAYQLMRRSVAGLMDAALPATEQKIIESVLDRYRGKGIQFHALLTRRGASRRFVSVHVLVPGAMTVHDAHHIAEDIEADIRQALEDAVVLTHIEPVDDEISLDDIPIDRK
jgi:cation diffusion facilitator family transporter